MQLFIVQRQSFPRLLLSVPKAVLEVSVILSMPLCI